MEASINRGSNGCYLQIPLILTLETGRKQCIMYNLILMKSPEGDSLSITKDIQNQTVELNINPKKFGIGGLREILRYSVFDVQQREIIIKNQEGNLHISTQMLRWIKKLSPRRRREELGAVAFVMKHSREVIIRTR